MPGEVDPRLIGLLQGVLALGDSLRDVGTSGEITVRLGREDGLAILKLVSGVNDAEAEASSQRGRPRRHGVNSLKLATLTFEWPKADAMRRRPQASRCFRQRHRPWAGPSTTIAPKLSASMASRKKPRP